jgi:predicted nucleic acid-binding protein
VTYLIDTNVISELRKGGRCDPNVAAWYAPLGDGDLYLSVLTLGEIRKGIDRAQPRDPARARALEKWLGDIATAFADRVLAVNRDVADIWGQMSAQRTIPVIDGLLAATAKVHSLTLATRNVDDVSGLGAKLLNPFEPQS